MTVFLRSARSIFKVHGPDAQKLLSDVFTGTIPETDQDAHWWALLSPQGKIQAEGLVGLNEGAYWLDISSDIAPKFFKRMAMYKLRADAVIENLSKTHFVGWSQNQSKNNNEISHQDLRHADLGFRIIGKKPNCETWQAERAPYEGTRTSLGIAEMGSDFLTDRLFPHDIGMDLLNGIDFSKGCYIGQEVVSRMRHRGNVRRRPVIVSLEDGNFGDEILLEGKSVGNIGQIYSGKTIGIVRLDKISNPNGAHVNEKPIKLTIPSWADYDFASASNPDK